MAISTVGSGQTYSTLQAWSDARHLNSGTEDAVCFAGSDLGALGLNPWTPTSTTISVAVGNQHNGTDAGHSGVAYMTGILRHGEFSGSLTIRGLRIEGALDVEVNSSGMSLTVLAENLLIIPSVSTLASLSTGAFFAIAPDDVDSSDMTVTFRNNIVFLKVAQPSDGIVGYATFLSDGISTLNLFFYNNTVSRSAGTGTGMSVTFDPGISGGESQDPILSLTARNNILLGTTGYAVGPFAAITTSNNLTTDATADDSGGSGHLINQTASAVVVDVTINPTLKATSPAKDAGVTIAGFSTDAIGISRPQGSAWDIGALELVTSVGGRLRRAFPFRFFKH